MRLFLYFESKSPFLSYGFCRCFFGENIHKTKTIVDETVPDGQKIVTRTQSYYFDLQRQRCKNFNATGSLARFVS
jgi:hypothetical protein